MNDIIDSMLKMFPNVAYQAMIKVRDASNDHSNTTSFVRDCFNAAEEAGFRVVKVLVHPRGAGRKVIQKAYGYSTDLLSGYGSGDDPVRLGTLWGVEVWTDNSLNCSICIVGENELGHRRDFKF